LVGLVLEAEGVGAGEVGIMLVNNRAIRRYNREFLGRDYPTDVLSFPQEPDLSGPVPRLLGDIIVSTQMAKERASEFGATPEREFMLYLIHGLLHLLGYADHPPSEARRLESRQKLLLKRALAAEIRCGVA